LITSLNFIYIYPPNNIAIAIDLPVVTPAETATLETAVTLPYISTVKEGIEEEPP
jgi:hypothetical protein